MKRSKKQLLKSISAISMAAAVTVTGLPLANLVPSVTALAAGTPAERENSSVVYFVDCGDLDPTTVPDGEQLGTHNSVTDQVYGADTVTGYKWGIVDTVSNPLKNGAGENPWGGISTDWTWPFEQVTTDQTSKTATNRYTKNQYEKSIATRYLDYKFELENGNYLVEVGFTDPWNCSKKPSVYVNYGKADQQTIQEEFDVASNGGTVSAEVSVTDGELTVNARATGENNKAINMTYITITQAGDSAMAQKDLDALKIPAIVTADLSLPTTGVAGSSISWASDKPAVISTAGKVTRPGEEETDALVKLTATVTKGDVILTKEFSVTVSALNDLMGLEFFESDSVEVTDAYYDNALELDVKNLLKLDADRLLAGFRETAGYAAGETKAQVTADMKDKTRYLGGWENSLIGGHTLGHYLSALAQAAVNPGLSEADRQKVNERLDYIINALDECQQKTVGSTSCKEGYLFGAELRNNTTNLEFQFDNVEKGLANIGTQAWVPWYTMHKILAGLVDSYNIAGNEKALKVAKKLGDWVSNRTKGWSSATQNTVLSIEYGGMNDALYELYKCTGEEKYKTAAHMFDEVSLFESVLSGNENVLNGKHANTTIPKFLGALGRYEADHSEIKYLQYAESFWDMVLERHTYITGGNSEDEHFGADYSQNSKRDNVNNETCNTYNMLKLSRQLFVITGDKKYSDYYERTLINAIMSSQDHESGLTMYFQPMATGYQKVFGSLESSFWCCTGSGYENFTKLQDSIYFKKENKIVVNQYLASKVTGDGYVIEQTGDLSTGDTMTFTVSGTKLDFDMRLRIPDWVVDGKATVQFAGEESEYAYAEKNGYLTIPSEKITNGVTFTIKLPMEVVAYNLPDGENTYAFKYGPYVLSAKLGTAVRETEGHGVSLSVPKTKAVASDSVGIRATETVEEFIENINDYLVKAEGSMNFSLTGANFPYIFTTHYNQDTENYGIYWTYYVDVDGRGSDEVMAEKAAARIEHATVDKIEQAGRGQYESRFLLPGGGSDGLVDVNNSSIGEDAPALTRRAAAGDSFGYKMEVKEGEDNYLYITYKKSEDGKPIKISIGDTVIANEVLDSENANVENITLAQVDQAEYYQVRYTIPKEVIANNIEELQVLENEDTVTKRVITITFAGSATEESARICKSVVVMKAFATENELRSITYKNQKITPVNKTYTITAPYTEAPEVTFEIADPYGYVEINGNAIDEKEAKRLSQTAATYTIKVYAEDFKTVATYTLKVNLDYTGLDTELKRNLVKAFNFEEDLNGAVAVTKAAVPPEKKNATYSYVDGKVGKAISLDGTYGLKLGDANILGNSYTISYWMNPKTIKGEYDPTFAAGTFSPEYWLNMTFNGRMWSSVANGTSGWIAADATNAYKANTWQQVTIVVDGTQKGTLGNITVLGKMYVNGELVYEGNVAKDIMTKNGAMLYWGVNAWDKYYEGAVDEMMFFNKALDSAEVSALATNAITTSDLGVAVKPSSVRLNKTSAELLVGDTLQLTATVAPNNATDKKVTYISSTPKVATVSTTGKVTAKAAGKATITVKTVNGKTARCTITVYAKTTKISVAAENYSILSNKLYIKKGTKVKLVSTLNDGAKPATVTTKNKKVVSVSGTTIKGVKAGNTMVTIQSGTKKKTIRVYVSKKAVKNKKLTLKKSKLTLKKKNATAQIAVKKLTKKSTDKISYKVVSGAKYVKVNKCGVVTAKINPAKKAKTAKIKVTCGKASKTVKVTVKK